ncbi:MAG: DNA adenine methylase [Flavobacteriaceae bacterium]|jgi:DNA adenine methylase|nr:DNA adenine methylase [Flavobacteriaceae bacterium]
MSIEAKPFLKWAGGKTQLIPEIESRFPNSFTNDEVVYIEPFVGSGALFFYVLNKYPNIKRAIINDVNTDLITTYRMIKENVEDLIKELRVLQNEYHQFAEDKEERTSYFLGKRALYNYKYRNDLQIASLFIFLNKTCFNGLYRVNSKGLYNVPIGSSKTPAILNESNLRAVSQVLQRVELFNGDYQEVLKLVEEDNVFFYFDPPYRPLSNTSSFNSYAKGDFNDSEQIRLKQFCDTIAERGFKWMLSNSDVKAANPEDNFFDDLYSNYTIERVSASRAINAKGSGRGKINELLINNYL